MQSCQFAIHLVKSINEIEDYSGACEIDAQVTAQALHSAEPYHSAPRQELLSTLIIDSIDQALLRQPHN